MSLRQDFNTFYKLLLFFWWDIDFTISAKNKNTLKNSLCTNTMEIFTTKCSVNSLRNKTFERWWFMKVAV